MGENAVVLLSGGLDSATCVGIAKDRGFEVSAVSFDYQQRHRTELDASRKVAAHFGVSRHFVFEVGLFREIGGSALTDQKISVPHNRKEEEMNASIPVTYVPARNLVFLSYALGVAERTNSSHIFVGVNALDYSGYPDCRPEFIESFAATANLATKAGVEGQTVHIEAPLMHLTKAEIVTLGTQLGVPYELTHSCYDPDAAGLACGECDSCALRRKGFEAAGVSDPTQYTAVA